MSQESVSIRQLVSDVAKDAKHLLQAQSELAKAESSQTKQQAGTTGGLFAVAAGAGAMGGVFLLITAAWGLVALGLPAWAGFGIVAAILLLIAAVTGILGRKKAKQIHGFATTKAEFARTRRALAGGKAAGTDLVVAPGGLPEQRS